MGNLCFYKTDLYTRCSCHYIRNSFYSYFILLKDKEDVGCKYSYHIDIIRSIAGSFVHQYL